MSCYGRQRIVSDRSGLSTEISKGRKTRLRNAVSTFAPLAGEQQRPRRKKPESLIHYREPETPVFGWRDAAPGRNQCVRTQHRSRRNRSIATKRDSSHLQ